MTTKQRLSIFAIAGIVALASVSASLMFNDNTETQNDNTETQNDNTETQNDNTETQNTERNIVVEPYDPDATPFHLQKHRSGLATMEAIEVENPPLEVIEFQELNPNEFDFIWRAINNGATFVSDGELAVYHEQVKAPKHRFVIKDGDSVRYYRTAVSAPPISYINHYIKILEYAEERNNIDFKPLDNTSRDSIAVQLDETYRWIAVDADTANSLKNKISQDGTFFTSFNERGTINFQLRYLGPLGEEFSIPELADKLAEAQDRQKAAMIEEAKMIEMIERGDYHE